MAKSRKVTVPPVGLVIGEDGLVRSGKTRSKDKKSSASIAGKPEEIENG